MPQRVISMPVIGRVMSEGGVPARAEGGLEERRGARRECRSGVAAMLT